MPSFRDRTGYLSEPCGECCKLVYGRTAEVLSKAMSRHLSIDHKIVAVRETYDSTRKHHATFKEQLREGRCDFQTIVQPRGDKANFDSSGAVEVFRELLFRRARLHE